MINNTIEELKKVTEELKQSIVLDIEDVKQANHASLLERNNLKVDLMEKLSANKQELNKKLAEAYKKGEDISVYKAAVDELETQLKELYELNGKLASIVLPVKEMYKDIIDEITKQNGGSLVEVMA